MFNVLNNIFDCSSPRVGKIKIETKKSHVDFMPNGRPYRCLYDICGV